VGEPCATCTANAGRETTKVTSRPNEGRNQGSSHEQDGASEWIDYHVTAQAERPGVASVAPAQAQCPAPGAYGLCPRPSQCKGSLRPRLFFDASLTFSHSTPSLWRRVGCLEAVVVHMGLPNTYLLCQSILVIPFRPLSTHLSSFPLDLQSISPHHPSACCAFLYPQCTYTRYLSHSTFPFTTFC
jgi:hypothetical protein